MAYTIKGDIQATRIVVQGKTVGAGISTTDNSIVYTADTSGHLDLPIPSASDIDYVLNQFPLSQYGAINNNPIGVSGTFDGGSTIAYYSSMPVLLENDGTLAFLRPGSNGATINYYYTYINTPETSTKPNTTIQKYYTGSSKNIIFYDSYTKDTLIYEDIDNHVIHLVLTNGTLQKSYHKEVSFNRTILPYNIMSALKVDSYVYIFALYNPSFNYNNPISINNISNVEAQFVVYRVPVSQIESGGTISSIEQVSGISGTNMYGTAVTDSNAIKIADTWCSTNESGTQSFIKYPGGLGIAVSPITYSINGAAKAYFDGTNIIFSYYTNCTSTNSSARQDTMYGFTITFNPSSKAYSTDLSNVPLTVSGGSTGTLVWNNPYSINSNKIYGTGNAISDGNSSSWYISESGIQYAVKEKYVLQDFYMVTRCSINGFTNKADAYKIRNRSLTLTSSTKVPGDYASRVGDQLTGGCPISSTRIMFTGTGSYQGVSYNKYSRGIADIGTAHTYTYNSLDRGTIVGYAPQNYRVPFGDTNESLTRSKISLCDAAGNVNAYGCAFIENSGLSAGFKLNPNTLSYDTTISISNTTLVNLKNSILANAGITNPADAKIGLYYVPDSSYCKSIATVAVYNGSGLGGRYLFATVDCTLSGTVVNTATLNTVFVNNPYTNMQSINIDSNEIFAKSGLSCVKYADFTYIAISGLLTYRVPGDSNELSCAGVVDGNTVSNAIVSASYHVKGNSSSAREYSYIPNLGFGFYLYGNTDKGTKLIFKNCGNTLAQFNSNIVSGTGTDVVILAQDIPQGFYIYFTETTPLFISGQYFDVPISVISLDQVTASPGNKSYFIYIQLVLGTPRYVASLTELPESSTTMFIGTATTDGTKVSSLNIKKVSRFDVYRPSLTQIGSAFPVSSGNPTQSGTIGW
ncbi:structural protein [Pectobacterium phage vB_PcaM_CBB]|uniref:Structural protein n=1 Tax=Pectobacterium phage vB_PcaM_CBB TaxID=2772511 RepID=A0A1L2CUK6_9CAUD|nr:structural protein [Pectobacterium phage vB_PcaM_CBB]AMM43713.1 structural protein [Pectobacterium phage vB_PcaM_CBB]